MILTWERARDTLSIIEAFIADGRLSDVPTDYEVVYNDELETIVVLIQGLSYQMSITSDDEEYRFILETEDPDNKYPHLVCCEIREIAKLEWADAPDYDED